MFSRIILILSAFFALAWGAPSRGRKTDAEGHHNSPPLPDTAELVEDENVEQGPVHRRFSGENHSQLSCKGVVQGLTPEGGRPYFRYIKVNTSSCLQRDIIIPSSIEFFGNPFDDWNITVTSLQFTGTDNSGAFNIPKRISMPTNVTVGTSSNFMEELETSFGFAVFIPGLDQQVKWSVEWEVAGCRPYENMCDKYNRERKVDFDDDAFSIATGYEVWTVV